MGRDELAKDGGELDDFLPAFPSSLIFLLFEP